MRKLRFVLPNTFTSLNFLLGVFSICWTTGAFGSFSTADQIRMGAYFVMLCALFDKLDGFAARLVDASSEFGAQFDSLADLIAFGLAPAFCFFFTYKIYAPEWFQNHGLLMTFALAVYVLCAAMRLAKYNACDSDTYHHHFSGLPSTFAGMINAVLIVYLKSKGVFADPSSFLFWAPIIVFTVTGFLMVSPLFLPKLQPRKNKAFNIFQIVLILLTYVAGILFYNEKVPFILEYLLLLGVSYMVIGFGVGLANRKQIIEEAMKSKK
ncbi:MAG: CDP-alcohol phosphatidyltransferase family protein [Fibrobacter sp.]|uniref:CDP-alcohol phosphatidyltransferase family protein n=1 Tax=Fibrobacter sp. TaxID=35828 RepID=UPI0025B82F63|nr:CDP-alcohol phosphatidyltransferase family protein [Fibrobacter sp.]MBQ7078784.1 CDP-alcohol phosphatidyltransferase family protein [Fibrobacter sp.]